MAARQEDGGSRGGRRWTRAAPSALLAWACALAACSAPGRVGAPDPPGEPTTEPTPPPPPPPGAPGGAPATDTAVITVGQLTGRRPVNRRVLGSNVQWVDGGDGLLRAGSTDFDEAALALVGAAPPTVLRYPGGSQADLYDWRAGIGPAASRAEGTHYFTGQRQPVLFGTAEFLALCARLGADPMVTVNLATAGAADAAGWVRRTNVERIRDASGAVLPRVMLWELGNEPYLRSTLQPATDMAPEEFARRADAAARAMRAEDADILLGLPLRTDAMAGVTLVGHARWAERVLAAAEERVDFVALHNTYLPFVWDGRAVGDTALFLASMAATRLVEADLAAVRAMLRGTGRSPEARIAVTEHNALYTLGGARDGDVASLGAALYVADLLRVLAETDDLLAANHWSLIGNGAFGAVSNRLEPRPVHEVLRAFDRALRGRLLAIDVAAPTFDAPGVGVVPASTRVPSVTALGAVDGSRVRLIVLHKAIARTAEVELRGLPPGSRVVEARGFGGGALFPSTGGASTARWRPIATGAGDGALRVALGPHELALLEVELPAP